MIVDSGSGWPRLEIVREDSEKTIAISALLEGDSKADIQLNLGTDPDSKSRPLIQISYEPDAGDKEELIIQDSNYQEAPQHRFSGI